MLRIFVVYIIVGSLDNVFTKSGFSNWNNAVGDKGKFGWKGIIRLSPISRT